MAITFIIYVAGCILASFYMGTLSFIFSVLVPSICLIIIFSSSLEMLYRVYVNDKIEQIKRNSKLKQLDNEIVHKLELIKIHNKKLKNIKNKVSRKKYGFIYLFEREDGILKIGCTYDPFKRLKEHEFDYDKKFKPIALWLSNNVFNDESVVLNATKEYRYDEFGHRELRNICPYKMIVIIENVLKKQSLNSWLNNE